MHSPIYPDKGALDDDDEPGPGGWLPAKIIYTDEPPKLPKKRRSSLRHKDWPRIRKFAYSENFKVHGPWLNAHAAAAGILEELTGLKIDPDALYKGIKNNFSEWFEFESKE